MTKVQGNPSMSRVDRNDLTEGSEPFGLHHIINRPAHKEYDDAATPTVTIAELLMGILEQDPTGNVTWTLPTAALAVAGIPNVAVGDSFDFSVINRATAGATEVITITPGSGGTMVAGGDHTSGLVPSSDTTHDVDRCGSALFRVRFTNVTASSEAYNLYQLSG